VWARLSAEGLKFGAWEPPVDVVDRGDELVVLVDAPGFSKEDIRVKVTETAVEVFAQRTTEIPIEGRYIIRQRVRDSIYRKVELPVKVRPELAKAKLENGVLEVRIPKSEVAKEIQVLVE
ncbi:MAG: Hsp20/alpha crystallin family protein, partial [Thermofilaceae archaeon]